MTEDDPMYRASTNREYEYTDKANKRSVWVVSTSVTSMMLILQCFPQLSLLTV